jgi:hypothetical protein
MSITGPPSHGLGIGIGFAAFHGAEDDLDTES